MFWSVSDPNAPFFDEQHKVYHLMYQDHLGIPRFNAQRKSWSLGVVFGHVVSVRTRAGCDKPGISAAQATGHAV